MEHGKWKTLISAFGKTNRQSYWFFWYAYFNGYGGLLLCVVQCEISENELQKLNACGPQEWITKNIDVLSGNFRSPISDARKRI